MLERGDCTHGCRSHTFHRTLCSRLPSCPILCYIVVVRKEILGGIRILKLLFYFIFCASRPGPVFTFFQLINTSPFVAAVAAGLHASYCHEAKGILGGVRAGIRVVTGPALAVRNIVLTGVPLNKKTSKKVLQKSNWHTAPKTSCKINIYLNIYHFWQNSCFCVSNNF